MLFSIIKYTKANERWNAEVDIVYRPATRRSSFRSEDVAGDVFRISVRIRCSVEKKRLMGNLGRSTVSSV